MASRRALLPANPDCRNCRGVGYTIDRRYRGITHQEYEVRWACFCRKPAPEPEPEPEAIGELPAWFLGLEEDDPEGD